MKNTGAKTKLLWKQYGLVWIGTCTGLYWGVLAGIYVVFDAGLVASDVSLTFARAWVQRIKSTGSSGSKRRNLRLQNITQNTYAVIEVLLYPPTVPPHVRQSPTRDSRFFFRSFSLRR